MRRLVRSQTEVARHFKVTDKTVGNWRRAGMPGFYGSYDLNQIEVWLKSRKYQGARFKAMEQETKATALLEVAVGELRRGLEHLVAAWSLARGRGRQRLLDQVLKGVVHGAMNQMSFLEADEGGKSCAPASAGELGGDGENLAPASAETQDEGGHDDG